MGMNRWSYARRDGWPTVYTLNYPGDENSPGMRLLRGCNGHRHLGACLVYTVASCGHAQTPESRYVNEIQCAANGRGWWSSRDSWNVNYSIWRSILTPGWNLLCVTKERWFTSWYTVGRSSASPVNGRFQVPSVGVSKTRDRVRVSLSVFIARWGSSRWRSDFGYRYE